MENKRKAPKREYKQRDQHRQIRPSEEEDLHSHGSAPRQKRIVINLPTSAAHPQLEVFFQLGNDGVGSDR
jgi:hypothetical protein